MPREKDVELWTAVSGLLALISRAYPNFSTTVYKGWHERSTYCFELLRFITTRHCSGNLERSACGSELMWFIPHKAFPLVCTRSCALFASVLKIRTPLSWVTFVAQFVQCLSIVQSNGLESYPLEKQIGRVGLVCCAFAFRSWHMQRLAHNWYSSVGTVLAYNAEWWVRILPLGKTVCPG